MTPESTPLATPVVSPFATPEATPFATTLPLIDAPTGGAGFPWGDALNVLSIVLAFVLLWTRIEKVELAGYWKGLLSFVGLVLLAAEVAGLGWPENAILLVSAHGLLALAIQARSRVLEDDLLARAAAVGRSTKPEMKALAKRLRQRHRVFRNLGRMKTAHFIDRLSEAARQIPEIDLMAPPVAHLWVIDRPELSKFVADFDRLMRLWRKQANEATAVADTVAAAAQISPMTIQEVIDSMIAIADPFPRRERDDQPKPGDPDPDKRTARDPE